MTHSLYFFRLFLKRFPLFFSLPFPHSREILSNILETVAHPHLLPASAMNRSMLSAHTPCCSEPPLSRADSMHVMVGMITAIMNTLYFVQHNHTSKIRNLGNQVKCLLFFKHCFARSYFSICVYSIYVLDIWCWCSALQFNIASSFWLRLWSLQCVWRLGAILLMRTSHFWKAPKIGTKYWKSNKM